MGKLRAVTLSAVAAATFAGSVGSSGEKGAQLPSPQPEQAAPTTTKSPTTETHQAGLAAACAALGELRGILGSGHPEPLYIFGSNKNTYSEAIFLPDKLLQQTNEVRATLLIDHDTVRSDQLGVDGLTAIVTSRQAAEVTIGIFDEFTRYEDPWEASAKIDQSGAAALIIHARGAADDAIDRNCN